MDKNENIKIVATNREIPENFYARFKEQLDKQHVFPGNYIFKFIIPTESKKVAQLHKIFDHTKASFSMKESRNGKYTSITIIMYVTDSISIIEYYKEASYIDGIVML